MNRKPMILIYILSAVALLLVLTAGIMAVYYSGAGKFSQTLVSETPPPENINDNSSVPGENEGTEPETSPGEMTGVDKGEELTEGNSSVPGNPSVTVAGTDAGPEKEMFSEKEEEDEKENKGESAKGDVLVYTPSEIRDFLYDGVEPPEKLVFLTFDDGPSNNNTPKVLDILKANGIKATFFYYTMDSLEDEKDVVERTINEGHSVGLHSNSHDYDKLYPGGTADIPYILADLKNCIETIRKIHPGFDTNVMRFPGGSISWDGMRAAKKAVRQWGVDSIDWTTMSGDADATLLDKSPENLVGIMSSIIEQHPDRMVEVVLMHDPQWNDCTVDALQPIIDYFKERGYTFAIIK